VSKNRKSDRGRSLRSKFFKNRIENHLLLLLGGMRYAQKFFRINFKFYNTTSKNRLIRVLLAKQIP